MLRSVQLENGLIVEFHDRSNRYFGDYHRVCVEVRSRVPLTPALFVAAADPHGECERARAVLGAEAVYVRTLERMGVTGAEVEAARQGLIDHFIRSAVPYLEHPAYPARLVAAELERRCKGRRPFFPG